MRENFKMATACLDRFIQSDYYILLVAILVFIGWFFNVWVPMICVLLVMSVLPLFFFKGTKHLLPFFMFFTTIISENRHELEKYKYLLIGLVVLLFVGCVFSLIRFKRDWSLLSPKKIKGFHVALFLLVIPFGLGGVGSPYENGLAVFLVFLLVLLIGVLYTFFVVTNAGDDRKQIMDYMIKTLFVLGLICVCQIITFYVRISDSFDDFINRGVNKGLFNIGWAGPNNVAPTISLTLPAAFYLCLKKNKFTPLIVLVIALEYALLVCLGCRGALLFSVLCLPFMIFYVAMKGENKILFCLPICFLFVVGVILTGMYGKEILQILSPMLDKGFDSSSRIEWLYPEAISVFRRWPIFGAGWDYRLGERVEGGHNAYTPFWYHSTFFQTLASMGVVGVIFFLVFYYWRYRTAVTIVKDPRAFCLITGVLMFDAYGMIDVNFFGPTFFLMLTLISFAIETGLEPYQGKAFSAKPFRRFVAWIENRKIAVEPAD